MLVHMSIHRPRPGEDALLVASMHRFGAAMRGKPGHLDAFVLRDRKTGRLIGLARWESEEEWRAAIPAMEAAVADDDFDAWELEPPESFLLDEL
jgi:heme-degrading monooxygenase HmoA